MPSDDIDQIVSEILAGMSLREKVVIAQLDEEDLPYLQYTFDVCIGVGDEMGMDVMCRMWKVLQRTHRLRVVK